MNHPHALGIISHLEAALADIVALSLAMDGVDIFACTFQGLKSDACSWENDSREPHIRFTQYVLDENPPQQDVPLKFECVTCSLRQAIVDFVSTRIASLEGRMPPTETFIILPQGIELAHLLPGLSEEMAEQHVHLMGVMHLLNVNSARDDLLSHIPLKERGQELLEDDGRCVAEVHQLNLAYADAIVALGDDIGGARELIEHLRPHDVLLFDSLDNAILEEIRLLEHNTDESIRRVHPATTQAWGGPCDWGTWTLDLYSDKPFHPQRLRDLIGMLCADGVYARGCFWLPTRPDEICSWEGIGQMLTVASAGNWSDMENDNQQMLQPHCHLILTGVGSPEVATEIEEAFGRILFADGEDMLAWVGVDDGFNEWFA